MENVEERLEPMFLKIWEVAKACAGDNEIPMDVQLEIESIETGITTLVSEIRATD